MTIAIIVKNTNTPDDPRRVVVSTVDTPGEGDVTEAVVAELAGGEEVKTYVTDTRYVEVRET